MEMVNSLFDLAFRQPGAMAVLSRNGTVDECATAHLGGAGKEEPQGVDVDAETNLPMLVQRCLAEAGIYHLYDNIRARERNAGGKAERREGQKQLGKRTSRNRVVSNV
jgi:hypothetical protein